MARPRLVRFPKPRVDDDSEFIRTLVWILAKARAGKVRGYAMVYVVENADPDEGDDTIEAATAFEPCDRLHILGAIRRMEFNFIDRQWSKRED